MPTPNYTCIICDHRRAYWNDGVCTHCGQQYDYHEDETFIVLKQHQVGCLKRQYQRTIDPIGTIERMLAELRVEGLEPTRIRMPEEEWKRITALIQPSVLCDDNRPPGNEYTGIPVEIVEGDKITIQGVRVAP